MTPQNMISNFLVPSAFKKYSTCMVPVCVCERGGGHMPVVYKIPLIPGSDTAVTPGQKAD